MRVFLAALAAFAFSLPVSADASIRYDLKIQPQPLGQALQEFAKQSGLQIIFFSKLTEGHDAPALNGKYTPESALGTLLNGTDLTFHQLNDKTIEVQPKAAIGKAANTTSISTPLQPVSLQPVSDRTMAGEPQGPSRVAQAEGQDSSNSAAGATKEKSPDSSKEESGNKPELQEIIVSAQKRDERALDVPVPVTAISAEQLSQQNTARLEDYFELVPGLSLSTSDYGWPLLAIRGLTTGGYTNPTVGVTVDDVPYGSSRAISNGEEVPDVDPSDLARVEVLRGPQGTLYGASSLGGLLKYVTLNPTTDKVSGRLEAGLSEIDGGSGVGYSTRGALNLPLSDTLATRISGFVRQDPGYIDNVLGGQKDVNRFDSRGGSISLLWGPSRDFSLKFTALLQNNKATGLSLVYAGLGDLQQSVVRGSGGSDKTLQAYALTLEAKLGPIDITSVSGFNKNTYQDSQDDTYAFGSYTQYGVPGTGFNGFGVPGSVQIEHDTVNRFTQEFRLAASIGDRIDGMLGAFYDHEASHYTYDFLAEVPETGKVVGSFVHVLIPNTFSETAGFANLTFHFSDRFDVQVGGRESRNEQSLAETASGPYVPAFVGQPSPIIFPTNNIRDDSFTYLLTPRFELSANSMIYARFASGYRPGGPNYNVPGIAPKYRADKTQNYEIGAKGEISRYFTYDASVYYIDWKNIQLALIDPTSGLTYYANGSRAKSRGVELAVGSRPLEGASIAAWVAWNVAELTRDLPVTSTAYGVSGDRLPYSSRLSANVSVDQDFPIKAGVTGFVGGSVGYVGDRLGVFGSLAAPQRQDLPGYAKIDLHGGAKMDGWKVNLYVNNVTNRRSLLAGGIGTLVPIAFQYIRPRVIGLSVSKSF